VRSVGYGFPVAIGTGDWPGPYEDEGVPLGCPVDVAAVACAVFAGWPVGAEDAAADAPPTGPQAASAAAQMGMASRGR